MDDLTGDSATVWEEDAVQSAAEESPALSARSAMLVLTSLGIGGDVRSE
jgi:hypothetical protein